MKLSDKYIITVLEHSGPQTFNELYHVLKSSFSYLDKSNLLRRLKRLRRKSHIRITKKGKFVSQAITKNKTQDNDLPANDFHEICKKYNYKNQFTKKQLVEAGLFKPLNAKDFPTRKDFRQDLVITIDGADAKDLDDAVSLVKTNDHFILSVHIADVSYYVKEDSHLDREARKRGNSVYLIDKVIPMLPEPLSNGICSLNPNEDRLALSVVINFNLNGEIENYNFYEGIINVAKRFTYDEVENVLQEKNIKETKYTPFIDMLNNMKVLAHILHKQRIRDGSLDFNLDEIEMIVDDKSFPIEIRKRKRLTSHRIIEEFMLIANQSVAKFLGQKGSSIYRIHETPDPEKLNTFNKFIRKMGYNLKDSSKPDPFELQELLIKIANKEEEKLINTILLRSMKQAYYHTENKGHFGLSFKDYTHFTSPIRRYSDLLIHRLLKDAIGIKTECKLIKNDSFLLSTTQHISITERTAMEAEREILKKKAARFMKNKVGEVFNGIVSGVTSFGLFVELLPYGVEGLIRISDLKGYYVYDEENYLIYREDKKLSYQLGSQAKVILTNVDVKRNFIDLVIAED
ncbi:MAG: ribonuclease R [Spirochaetota bacterium]|nr:ribonuclease R [Spirochaetota bacterium]